MSDIKLFRIQGDAVEPLQGSSVAIEASLQELIERHLEALLGVRLLAHEYQTGKTHRGRIDTLGIAENSSPVIIKYERALNRPLPPHDLRFTLVAQRQSSNFAGDCINMRRSTGARATADPRRPAGSQRSQGGSDAEPIPELGSTHLDSRWGRRR